MRWGIRLGLVVAALGLLGSACQGQSASPSSAPPSTISAQALDALAHPIPPPSVVATASVPQVAVYPTPDPNASPSGSLTSPNSLGQPLVFLVLAQQGSWLQVYLPERPNESTGWILASQVTLANDPVTILVQLSKHTLTVLRQGSIIDTIEVAVGAPTGPTPTGHFYVTEVITVPSDQPFFGPYAFGLSAFSNVYTEFDGGPGQTAMHGTDQPELIGQNVSHGCIRMTDQSATRLETEVPVGTPVGITA